MARKKDPAVVDIENRFAYHPATEVTGPKHDAIRADLQKLALKWNKDLPEGRHKALALTKLQEAMWAANAAVACDTKDEVVAETPVEPVLTEAEKPKPRKAALTSAVAAEAKPVRRVARRKTA